jgi:cation transport ATPase
MLSPYCRSIRNSKNTSLHSYTNIYIKESHIGNKVLKSISAIYKWLIQHLWIEEEIQTVSFIVPFSQICLYQDNFEVNNHETENNNHETENNDLETENNKHKTENNDLETENNDLEKHDSKSNDHENQETEKNHDNKPKKNHDNKSIITTILKKIITIIKIIMVIPKSNSIWNKFLHQPNSILFCNIDSNHSYNWWNFAAITDFKWKTFGRIYYYLIWLFYTIFYICYSLASTLGENSISEFSFNLLFIISIIFGSILLIFEVRYYLWNYKLYLSDIWNLFGK